MLGSQNRLSARSYFSGAPLALFLFSLSAILTDAAADDCAPVRLDQPGGTFEKIEVRDQKYGSCVVESVTQFMEALARIQGKGRLGFSSLEMLIRAAADPLTDSDGKNFAGFTYSNVLNLAFEVGLCTQEKVAQNLRLQSLDERKLLDAFGEWVNQIDQEARRAKVNHDALDERYQNRQRLRPIDNVDMGMNRKYYQWESLGIEQAMVLNIQQFMVETRKKTGIPDSRFSTQRIIKPFAPLFERFSSMFPTLCPWYGREYMKNTGRLDTYTLDTQNGALSINGLSVGNPKFFTAKMNQHLLSPHPLPIPVSYCSRSLIDGKGAYGMLRTHLKDDTCGRHASLIIGQRRNPASNRCEYLIRNSWGTNGNSFRNSDGFEWEAETTKVEVDEVVGGGWRGGGVRTGKKIWITEKTNYTGNFWVDREAFLKNLVYEAYFYQN